VRRQGNVLAIEKDASLRLRPGINQDRESIGVMAQAAGSIRLRCGRDGERGNPTGKRVLNELPPLRRIAFNTRHISLGVRY
jgi:hypothetical protein